MSHTMICSTAAALRHPVEAAQILKKINTSRRRKDKTAAPVGFDDVSWSYDTAIAIRPGSRHPEASRLRGRGRLELVKDDLFIRLSGCCVRNRATVALDNVALLSGPDAGLPVEVLGGPEPLPAKTSAPRLWLWQPTRENAPGWVAHVVTAARPAPRPLHPGGLLLELDRAGEASSVWFDGEKGFHGGATDEFAAATRPKRVRTAPSVDIGALVAANAGSDGRWKGLLIEATIAELVARLQGPGFMAFSMGGTPAADTGPGTASSAPPPGPSARFFDTHETLSNEEVSALATLEERSSGVIRGDQLFAMLSSRDIYRADSGETEHRVALRAVANGEAVSDVVARGQAAIESRRAEAPTSGPLPSLVRRHR